MQRLNALGSNPSYLEAERREYQRWYREYLRRFEQAEVYESDNTYALHTQHSVLPPVQGPPVQPEYVPTWPFDDWGTLYEERPEGEPFLC